MADAVFYDPASGRITATISASQDIIEGDGRPFVMVPEYRLDWDATHAVIDGQLVEQTAE